MICPSNRKPGVVRITPTIPWQVVLYRLTGDDTIIHSNPRIARETGFDRPILHVSCADLGLPGVQATVCNYDSARMRSLGAQFTGVMYPGETIKTEL